MKALYYTGTGKSEYREAPEPELQAGDALLRIDAVGICGSDMHAWHGHDPRRVPPMILGHEGSGTVLDAAGGAAANDSRVVFNPLISCGTCDYCDEGRANLCQQRELVGMRLPGAFAERIAVPARNLIEIPERMKAEHAALTEPCATAWHALALAAQASYSPVGACRALVIGAGSVGLLGALILKSWGAREVRIAETNPLRRATAEAAGIEAFCPIAHPAEAASVEWVMDAVGSVPTRAAAIKSVRPGGVITHVGLQEWAGEFDARTLTLSEVTFVGVYTYTNADLIASMHALHDGRLGALEWVEVRSLSDGARAFEDLDAGRTAAAKIILAP